MRDKEFRLLIYVVCLILATAASILLWGGVAGLLAISVGGCALSLTVLNN